MIHFIQLRVFWDTKYVGALSGADQKVSKYYQASLIVSITLIDKAPFNIHIISKKCSLPALVRFNGQEGGEYKNVVRRSNLKERDVSIPNIEERVRLLECNRHINKPIQQNSVPSKESPRRIEIKGTSSTENGMEENHSSLYQKVQNNGTELVKVEDLSHLQT